MFLLHNSEQTGLWGKKEEYSSVQKGATWLLHTNTKSEEKDAESWAVENSDVTAFYMHFVESVNNYTDIMEKHKEIWCRKVALKHLFSFSLDLNEINAILTVDIRMGDEGVKITPWQLITWDCIKYSLMVFCIITHWCVKWFLMV